MTGYQPIRDQYLLIRSVPAVFRAVLQVGVQPTAIPGINNVPGYPPKGQVTTTSGGQHFPGNPSDAKLHCQPIYLHVSNQSELFI